MGPLILAWLIGEGIVVTRSVKARRPPMPGQLLVVSALFAGLALVAEYEPARPAATLFAYGIDVAVLMQVLPGLEKTSTVPAGTQVKTGAPQPVNQGRNN